MDLLRQVFYPMGMMAGGVSLLLGSGAMKRRQRRFATYLRTAGRSLPCRWTIWPVRRTYPAAV